MILEADKPQVSDSPVLNLHEYWRVIMKRKWLIAIAVAASLAVAFFASILTTPTYKATVLLSVERERATAFDIGNAMQPSGYDPEFLPTQTRLMQSRELAERVVRQLRLAENPATSTASSGFLASLVGRKEPAKADVPVVEPAVTQAARNIQGGIQTSPVRGTTLVELSYVAADPQLAADVANALANAYIDWNLESKFQVVGQASRFLTTQIEQLKTEIDLKERELLAYGAETDIVSVDPQTNITLQKLEALNRDYAQSVADRVTKEARYYELQNARPESIADTLSSGVVAQLRSEVSRLEREYADKLNLYKPEWPAMQQLKAQIDQGKQNLTEAIEETVTKARDNARTDYLAARRREQSLAGVLQGQKREAMTLNSNAVEYNNLRTEVETRRTLLDSLMERQAETEVASRLRGERVSNIRIVDSALPPTFRFRPSYRQNATRGFLFGLAIGLGLAFLLEYLDRSVRSTDQVESHLGLPALGIIPEINPLIKGYPYTFGTVRKKVDKTKEMQVPPAPIELLPHTQPRSTAAEAYRAVRASLLLSRAGGLRSVAVTSSLPGEGKTSTAVNLAVVLGQLNKRVLVVDGDLHKPRLHEVFRLSNRHGLVTVLAEGVDPAAIVKATQVPNVFVMPSGPSSPNPSGLLSSDAMARFAEWATENFDYVIYDTPPVGPVADAYILGNLADGVVLAVQGGRTPREVITQARDNLRRSNVRILGVLINSLPERDGSNAYYYSYYGKTAYGDTKRTSAANA